MPHFVTMGRTGIKVLELSVPALQPVEPFQVIGVEDKLRDYASLITLGSETFGSTTAKMYVSGDAQHKFFKPRPLLLAIRDGVTQEIQIMEA